MVWRHCLQTTGTLGAGLHVHRAVQWHSFFFFLFYFLSKFTLASSDSKGCGHVSISQRPSKPKCSQLINYTQSCVWTFPFYFWACCNCHHLSFTCAAWRLLLAPINGQGTHTGQAVAPGVLSTHGMAFTAIWWAFFKKQAGKRVFYS